MREQWEICRRANQNQGEQQKASSGEKGKQAEKLSGCGGAAGQEAGAGLGVRELLRFLLMPVPFSLFLLVEGKCF